MLHVSGNRTNDISKKFGVNRQCIEGTVNRSNEAMAVMGSGIGKKIEKRLSFENKAMKCGTLFILSRLITC